MNFGVPERALHFVPGKENFFSPKVILNFFYD